VLPIERGGLRTFAVASQLRFISGRPGRGPSTIAITVAGTFRACTSPAFFINGASGSTPASGTATVGASGATAITAAVIIPGWRIITATRWRGSTPFVPPYCRRRVLRPLNAQPFAFENTVVHFIVRIFCIPFNPELNKSIPASRGNAISRESVVERIVRARRGNSEKR